MSRFVALPSAPYLRCAPDTGVTVWAEIYAKFRKSGKPLPGARGLLRYLKEIGILDTFAASGQPAQDDLLCWQLRLPPRCPSSQEVKRSVRIQTLIFFFGPRRLHSLTY